MVRPSSAATCLSVDLITLEQSGHASFESLVCAFRSATVNFVEFDLAGGGGGGGRLRVVCLGDGSAVVHIQKGINHARKLPFDGASSDDAVEIRSSSEGRGT